MAYVRENSEAAKKKWKNKGLAKSGMKEKKVKGKGVPFTSSKRKDIKSKTRKEKEEAQNEMKHIIAFESFRYKR